MGGRTFSPQNWSTNLTQGAAMDASHLEFLRSDRKSAPRGRTLVMQAPAAAGGPQARNWRG